MSKRFVITESEKNHIKNLYGIVTEQTNPNVCTFTSKSSNLPDYNQILQSYGNDFNKISNELTTIAGDFMKSVPDLKLRSACQAALNKIRPSYKDKNFIIIDQLKNTAYFFDKDGKYLTGSWIISGRDTPNEKWKEFASSTLEKRTEMSGGDEKKAITQPGASFLPPDVYKSAEQAYTVGGYQGTGQNMVFLYNNKDNTEVTQALHGTAEKYPERLKNQQIASKIPLSKELPKDLNLDLSSGCINFPGEFIDKNIEMLKNAYVFVIKSDQNDYFVFNPNPLITNPNDCHNPNTLDIQLA